MLKEFFHTVVEPNGRLQGGVVDPFVAQILQNNGRAIIDFYFLFNQSTLPR